MKTLKEFLLPDAIVKEIGDEWAGVYKVHMLDAREYLQVMDDVARYCLATFPDWDGVPPQTEIIMRIVCKASTHDGKPIDPTLPMPGKLYEILSSIAIPANTLSKQESQALFLDSSTSNQPAKPA